jgi:hypothetical protein
MPERKPVVSAYLYLLRRGANGKGSEREGEREERGGGGEKKKQERERERGRFVGKEGEEPWKLPASHP